MSKKKKKEKKKRLKKKSAQKAVKVINGPKTDRLISHSVSEADLSFIREIFDSPKFEKPKDIRDAFHFVQVQEELYNSNKKDLNHFNLTFIFGLYNDNEEFEPVGLVQITHIQKLKSLLKEGLRIRYMTHTDYRGSGLTKEMVCAMIPFLHERFGIERFCTTVGKGNIASRKILEAAGFSRDRVIELDREKEKFEGKPKRIVYKLDLTGK